MAIKWEAYDVHDQLTLFEAACLWFEIEPSARVWLNIPLYVDSLLLRMEQFFEGCTIESGERFLRMLKNYEFRPSDIHESLVNCMFLLVTRQQLIEYANKVKQRPKFLFPEARVSFEAIPDPKDNEPESTLPNRQHDPRYIKSLLRLAKTQSIALKWLPGNSDTVGRLHRVAESNGIKLGDDTIRSLLRDAFEVDKDTE